MDIILYNIVVGFCSLFFGYIFGSIPTGVIIGKLFYHRDPRVEGSKNSGGTNVGRLYGKKAGVLVIVLDMIKCAIPMITVWAIISFSSLDETLIANYGSGLWDNGILYIYLAPVGVALGHCWPLFAGFIGGKAVATFCGFGISSSWLLIIVGVTTFFGTLKLKKYVSLASILTAIITTISAWVLCILKYMIPGFNFNIFMWGNGSFLQCEWEYALAMTLVSLMLIYRHKANIIRLVHHEERKITWIK